MIFHTLPFLKIAWTRHTNFTISLSHSLKIFCRGFLKFDEKLDVNSLLTFWIRHFLTERNNTSALKHSTTGTEYSEQHEACHTVSAYCNVKYRMFIFPSYCSFPCYRVSLVILCTTSYVLKLKVLHEVKPNSKSTSNRYVETLRMEKYDL